jgi:hypothetical protein
VLRDRDDRPEAGDLRLVATKRQVAIVRALVDELERCLARGGATAAREQLVHELARLGRKTLETAAALSTKTAPTEEKSGVHSVVALTTP